MLYLFLTGKNSAYLDDIFTTLYLPTGMLHSFKYNCRADASVVDFSLITEVITEEAVLISYIDRDVTEKEKFYMPLRKGLFVKCERTDGQCYFTVRLQEWCYAKQEDQFSKKLLSELGNKLYQRNENSEEPWKGLLAMKTKNSLAGELETTGNSWYLTAERLSRRKLFKDVYSIFTRLEIQSADGKTMEPLEYDGESGYELSTGKRYRLMLSYYIPEFNNDVMIRIPVILEEMCGALKANHCMESRQNKILASLYPESTDERKNTVLSMTIPQVDVNGKIIRYSPAEVNVWVKSRMSNNARIAFTVLCGLGITAASVLSGFSYDDLESQGGLWGVIRSGRALYQLAGGCFAAISTYFMVKLTGKPKL